MGRERRVGRSPRPHGARRRQNTRDFTRRVTRNTKTRPTFICGGRSHARQRGGRRRVRSGITQDKTTRTPPARPDSRPTAALDTRHARPGFNASHTEAHSAEKMPLAKNVNDTPPPFRAHDHSPHFVITRARVSYTRPPPSPGPPRARLTQAEAARRTGHAPPMTMRRAGRRCEVQQRSTAATTGIAYCRNHLL